MHFNEFVRNKRKVLKLTQPELAEKAGVGLRFLRDLEQGKVSLRLDKVNQVLALFGFEAGPVKSPVTEEEASNHVTAEEKRRNTSKQQRK